jgi:hypothetical protein
MDSQDVFDFNEAVCGTSREVWSTELTVSDEGIDIELNNN